MNSTRRPGIPWLALGLLIMAFGYACDGEEQAGGGAGSFQRPPTPVEVADVVQEPITDRFDAVGTVEANEAITVVSEIPGVVLELPFREGEFVAKGALLARLDDAELSAALARARAIRDQRQASFDRIQGIVAQGAGAPQDLDDAAAELKIAEADVALSKARMAKTRILAPFGGRVGSRQVSPGAFLQPGDTITQLAAIRSIKIRFTAPERYVPKLERGARVGVSSPAFPGEALQGTIDVVDPVLDAETRSARVIAVADNPGERFRPGMSATISAVLSQRDQALTIPSEAIFAEGDQALVYLVKPDSTVARTPISLGLRLAATVEVVSGLSRGQQVVRAGHQKLYEGARVQPVSSRAGGGAGGTP